MACGTTVLCRILTRDQLTGRGQRVFMASGRVASFGVRVGVKTLAKAAAGALRMRDGMIPIVWLAGPSGGSLLAAAFRAEAGIPLGRVRTFGMRRAFPCRALSRAMQEIRSKKTLPPADSREKRRGFFELYFRASSACICAPPVANSYPRRFELPPPFCASRAISCCARTCCG
jgi:hypothetical protein